TLRREYSLRGGSVPAVGLAALAPWLHGLRAASKVRTVAKRTAVAAAATVTGLAAVSAVPFVLPHRHAPATTQGMAPALHVRAVVPTVPRAHAARPSSRTATGGAHGAATDAPTS